MHTSSRLQPRGRFVPASLVLALLSSLPSAFAATYTWDPGLTPASPTGGTGTWNTSTANWSNGSTDVAWPNLAANDDKAVFAGSAGTVTLGSSLTAGGVQFNTSGYTLSGASTDLTLSPQATGSDAFVVSTGVENITIGLRKLILTANGSGSIGDLINLDKVNFGSTIVAFSGSRQMALSNSSATATTTIANFAVSSGTGTNGASLYLNQGNLTIQNLSSGSSSTALAAASSTATNAGLAIRYNGSDSTKVGTLTLSGNNTLLNNAGTGNFGINLLNPHATYDIQHNNALGARDASNALTDTYVEFNGGTLVSSNGARTLENAITHTGSFTIGGSNAITLAGAFTQSGGNRTLTNNNTGGLTLSGSVFLANDNATARTLTLAGSGNTTIGGAIANNNAGNTLASALTITNTGTTVLSGANTYTGATTINAGAFLVNGSHVGAGAYSVASGATLGGTGSINLSAGNGNVTLANGAKLQSSSVDGISFALGTGSLDLSGALSAGSASMLFTLDAPGATLVSASAANIGSGVLNFDDFSFTTGAGFGAGTYTLFDLTSIAGTLGSNLTGVIGGLDATISLVGNDIVLTTVSAIPEPSSAAALAGLAGLGLVVSRRRRR